MGKHSRIFWDYNLIWPINLQNLTAFVIVLSKIGIKQNLDFKKCKFTLFYKFSIFIFLLMKKMPVFNDYKHIMDLSKLLIPPTTEAPL